LRVTVPLGHRALRGWLLWLWAAVLVMVMIGGITRLTGSGLSIVEWRPVTGLVPPLSDAAWQRAFDGYRSSPQFVHQNNWMALTDFKRIYFWEYVHRLWGRLLGFATLVPWLYFLWRRRMSREVALRTLSIVVLGGLQGAVGWLMVKSGLVDEPRVSHYRLAVHLLLGIGIGQWILWQALELHSPRQPALRATSRLRVACLFVLPLVALQVVYGAFMAGLHAGYVAATFPDMNGHYAPQVFFTGLPGRDFFDNPMAIHWLHRALALALLIYACVLSSQVRRRSLEVRAAAYLLLAATLGQAALGALTVVLRVPVGVAVAHQAGAYVLCSAAVLLVHAALGGVPSPQNQPLQASASDAGPALNRA
jgi:cytochrome c oxidase assembly protein subunit 15